MTQLKLSGAAGKTQKTGRLLCCEGATETDDCQEERGKLSIRPYIRPSIHPSIHLSVHPFCPFCLYMYLHYLLCLCSRGMWWLRGAYCWKDYNIHSWWGSTSLSRHQTCSTLSWTMLMEERYVFRKSTSVSFAIESKIYKPLASEHQHLLQISLVYTCKL